MISEEQMIARQQAIEDELDTRWVEDEKGRDVPLARTRTELLEEAARRIEKLEHENKRLQRKLGEQR